MAKRMRRGAALSLALLAAGPGVFALTVMSETVSHLWSALALAAVCFAALIGHPSRAAHLVWWNCGLLLALWGVADGAALLWAGDRVVPIRARFLVHFGFSELMPDNEIDRRDPYLGKAHAPGGHENRNGIVDTIDADGLRISPSPIAGATAAGCVLFFGCSYTFGDGVSNEQTFPYLVELGTGGRFRSRNFGVGGGSPSYALGQLNAGVVERSARCAPTHAFYLLIPHHLLRSSGKSIVRQGPRFVLQPDGSVIEDGTLNRSTLDLLLDTFLYTSALYVATHGYDQPLEERDVELAAALLRTFHERLRQLYPGVQFHILHWDDPPLPQLDAHLTALGIPVHRISSIVPGLHHEAGYLPDDHHPNVAAHERIAQYIVQTVLEPPGIGPPVRLVGNDQPGWRLPAAATTSRIRR